MSKIPSQPQDKYVLRMPDGMRDELKDLASKNGRSLNAEIVLRLERSLWLEKAGVLSGETTVHDLVSKPTGEQIVKTLRSLREQTQQVLDMLELEENADLRSEMKEHVRSEKRSATGSHDDEAGPE